MTALFERALERLRSEGDLSPSDMRGLSDMGTASAARARSAWGGLSVERRRTAMQLAGTLADKHIELNFDRLAEIGLHDSDPVVRRQAVANLWECQDASLPQQFLGLLESDTDEGVREEAARALGRFVLEMEQEESVGEVRPRLERALLSALQSSHEGLKLRALESLGFSSRPQVPRAIQDAYDSGGEEARRASLLAMGRSGERRWREAVMAELRSPSPAVRREAAHAAGELELRSAVPELIELIDDVDHGVQLEAIWSLGEIGGRTAERALLRAQRSAGEETTERAFQEALEHLAFIESTRDLEAALRAREDSN